MKMLLILLNDLRDKIKIIKDRSDPDKRDYIVRGRKQYNKWNY